MYLLEKIIHRIYLFLIYILQLSKYKKFYKVLNVCDYNLIIKIDMFQFHFRTTNKNLVFLSILCLVLLKKNVVFDESDKIFDAIKYNIEPLRAFRFWIFFISILLE